MVAMQIAKDNKILFIITNLVLFILLGIKIFNLKDKLPFLDIIDYIGFLKLIILFIFINIILFLLFKKERLNLIKTETALKVKQKNKYFTKGIISFKLGLIIITSILYLRRINFLELTEIYPGFIGFILFLLGIYWLDKSKVWPILKKTKSLKEFFIIYLGWGIFLGLIISMTTTISPIKSSLLLVVLETSNIGYNLYNKFF